MIGVVVNNFEIVGRIGEGGMGAVFLARHPVIGKQVAIKVLRPDLCTDELQLSRFVNEARAASAIRHPGIVEALDFGSMPDSGRPYLMMEYLVGESLAARLKRDPPAAAEIVELGRQTAEALHAAHTRGIVHRDLKPDNVMLVPDETVAGGVRVKVLDFGIAKLSDEMAGASMKTRTGVIFGTPVYMSPEQCQGQRGLVDARSDVYALGVILYEMCCRRPPFDRGGVTDVMLSHATDRPIPVRKLNPRITPALESVVLRALAKAPDDRQASMAELAAELVAAGKASRQTPAQRRRLQLAVTLGAAVIGAAATGLIIRANRREVPRPPPATVTYTRPSPSVTPLPPPKPTPPPAAQTEATAQARVKRTSPRLKPRQERHVARVRTAAVQARPGATPDAGAPPKAKPKVKEPAGLW